MCGIGAIMPIGEERQKNVIRSAVTNMLLELQKKGEHATGVCAIYPDHEEILKKPLKADLFVKTPEFVDFIEKHWKASLILTHCRHATKGEPSKNFNNHPLESDNFILLHNGIISDDAERMLDKLDIAKWEPEIETDSYFINKVAEIYGIDSVPSIRGSMAIIMYDKTDKRLIIYRNHQDLNVGYNKDLKLLAVATTEEAIESALTEKKYFLGLIEIGNGQHEILHNEVPKDVMFITHLKPVHFERFFSCKSFHAIEIESWFDEFYDTVALNLGNLFAIQFKQVMKEKIKKVIDSKKFTIRGGIFMLSRNELNSLMSIVAKYKEKRVAKSLRDWDNWGRYYT